jgi:hypothetical protein
VRVARGHMCTEYSPGARGCRVGLCVRDGIFARRGVTNARGDARPAGVTNARRVRVRCVFSAALCVCRAVHVQYGVYVRYDGCAARLMCCAAVMFARQLCAARWLCSARWLCRL